MPHSDGTQTNWVTAQLLREVAATVDVTHIVDVGCGAGSVHARYAHLFPGAVWTAIEVWRPYVDRFTLKNIYDVVLCKDVRGCDLPDADLYFFGDVLEHMPVKDAVEVWERARQAAPWLVITIPVRPYPQGPHDDLGGFNPYEEHVATYSMELVQAAFAGIVASAEPVSSTAGVGAFLARGKVPLIPPAEAAGEACPPRVGVPIPVASFDDLRSLLR